MAKAYSYDLRQKVINAIKLDGMKKSEAAQVFQLSRNTIDLWLKRQAETGDYQACVESPTANSQQNYRLGKVCSVCQEVWRQDTSPDGCPVGG